MHPNNSGGFMTVEEILDFNLRLLLANSNYRGRDWPISPNQLDCFYSREEHLRHGWSGKLYLSIKNRPMVRLIPWDTSLVQILNLAEIRALCLAGIQYGRNTRNEYLEPLAPVDQAESFLLGVRNVDLRSLVVFFNSVDHPYATKAEKMDFYISELERRSWGIKPAERWPKGTIWIDAVEGAFHLVSDPPTVRLALQLYTRLGFGNDWSGYVAQRSSMRSQPKFFRPHEFCTSVKQDGSGKITLAVWCAEIMGGKDPYRRPEGFLNRLTR
jgi:hypothetical protein